MPLLCFSDIVILGPRVHFCPGPSRESSWKLSAASTTPKLSPAPIGSSQPGTAGISFRFSSCQLEGKAKERPRSSLASPSGRPEGEWNLALSFQQKREQWDLFALPPPINLNVRTGAGGKGSRVLKDGKFKKKLSSFWCSGWGPKWLYVI